MSKTVIEITATLVKEQDRMDFLPSLLGPFCTAVELRLFDYMTRMVEEYEGGYWDFYRLSNGGGFMKWDAGDLKEVHVKGDLNYYKGTMSPEAASLAMFAMAVNHTMWSGTATRQMDQAWGRVMQYIYQHQEHAQMLAFLD